MGRFILLPILSISLCCHAFFFEKTIKSFKEKRAAKQCIAKIESFKTPNDRMDNQPKDLLRHILRSQKPKIFHKKFGKLAVKHLVDMVDAEKTPLARDIYGWNPDAESNRVLTKLMSQCRTIYQQSGLVEGAPFDYFTLLSEEQKKMGDRVVPELRSVMHDVLKEKGETERSRLKKKKMNEIFGKLDDQNKIAAIDYMSMLRRSGLSVSSPTTDHQAQYGH